MRSREFVGVAEGIKSHELSTKGKIEQLKGRISELSGQKRSLNGTISYLESAIAAAYEDTDEDGDPDYALIASLESQKASAEDDLESVEQDLDVTGGELSHSESELEGVLEEKAQTLFEIQERARKTSNNIALAGGMYGAYAGVGGSLQSSMQTSLSSLSQAAGILGGSIDTAGGGSSGGSSGSSSSATNGTTHSDIPTSPVAAFSNGGSSGGVSSSVPTASKFSSTQTGRSTPGTMPNFHSGQKTINAQKPLNFSSEQASNAYAISGFADSHSNVTGDNLRSFVSEQKSSGVDTNFNAGEITVDTVSQDTHSNESNSKENIIGRLLGIKVNKNNPKEVTGQVKTTERSDLKKKRTWSEQYKVGFTPTATSTSSNVSANFPSAPKRGPRELADELDYELSMGSLLSRFGTSKNATVFNSTQSGAKNSADRRSEFLQRIKVEVNPVTDSTNATSNSAVDDAPNIGARIKQRDEGNLDREQDMVELNSSKQYVQKQQDSSRVQRDIDSIKSKFASFMQKESLENKSKSNSVVDAQRIIDNYCNKELSSTLLKTKQAIRLTDSVEFQDDETFAMGLGGYERAAGVNGYNNGKKSYVKNSGPHPQKTAIHEHNHQLSCNDVKDKFGYITEYRRGISINGRDRQVNEALTEYFTKKMMGNKYPSNPNVGYKDNMLRIEKMESGFGKEILKQAYYQNKPQLLKTKYESVMGEGTWDVLSRAFDESLRKYTKQEVQDIRKHYLNTGTRLITETDIIRKKAIDYANRCATLFVAKSKGVI